MRGLISAAVAMLAVFVAISTVPTKTAEAGVTGGLHTTNINCGGVDLNLYSQKTDVYIEGGPSKTGASALTPGFYGVHVTSPNGVLLGASPGATVEVDADGVLPCVQLWSVVLKASDNSQGYDDTPNNGGEYKVQICLDDDFDGSDCKSDNFKVTEEVPPFDACTPYPNRIIVGWPGFGLGDPAHPELDEESPVAAVAIAAGTYRVTLQSYDDHSGHPGQTQLNEQWFAVFLDGATELESSGIISDLPEDQDTINEIVGQVTLASDADGLIARHKMYGNWGATDAPESIQAVCLALDPLVD